MVCIRHPVCDHQMEAVTITFPDETKIRAWCCECGAWYEVPEHEPQEIRLWEKEHFS